MRFATLYLLVASAAAVSFPRLTDISFLGVNGTHIQCDKQAAAKPKGHGYGKNSCPCVGIDNLRGYFAAILDYHHVQYPLETGASCGPWENGIHPDCSKPPMPDWCSQSWCYVDPCNCDLDVPPKKTVLGTTFQGAPSYYSYDTCSGFDFWTQDKNPQACVLQKDAGACAAAPDCAWDGTHCLGKSAAQTCASVTSASTQLYGQQDCRCVGLGGHANGLAVRYVSDSLEALYNSNVGSTCAAWEMEAHPECKKDGVKPGWCSQKWCFVDPCKCNTAVPPKAVMMANAYERYQGKTAYFSYKTCGSTDSLWTEHMKFEYCYAHNTEESCKTVKKCRWTGSKCMGEALASTCAEQKATGVLGMDSPFAEAGARKLGYSSALLIVFGLLAVGGQY